MLLGGWAAVGSGGGWVLLQVGDARVVLGGWRDQLNTIGWGVNIVHLGSQLCLHVVGTLQAGGAAMA